MRVCVREAVRTRNIKSTCRLLENRNAVDGTGHAVGVTRAWNLAAGMMSSWCQLLLCVAFPLWTSCSDAAGPSPPLPSFSVSWGFCRFWFCFLIRPPVKCFVHTHTHDDVIQLTIGLGVRTCVCLRVSFCVKSKSCTRCSPRSLLYYDFFLLVSR